MRLIVGQECANENGIFHLLYINEVDRVFLGSKNDGLYDGKSKL